MLFVKPIQQISYTDVLTFCEDKTPEGFILDYKSDFPTNDNLAKVIASFANTYGGILIIGINAPKGIPIPPYEGIKYNESMKYEEQIQHVILSHIKEPVFPEIKVCEPIDNKTFIIIRVPESHITPHRVGNNRKVYIRTGEISKPIDEAPWGKIEWLISRREKSEQLRNYLITESDNFYKESFFRFNINLSSYFGIISLRTLPLFPQQTLLEYKGFQDIERIISVREDGFPEYPIHLESIQNGVQGLLFINKDPMNPIQDDPFLFLHLTRYGVYLYKRDAGIKDIQIRDDYGQVKIYEKGFLNIYNIIWHVNQFLTSALQFYKYIGFWGTLLFEVKFENVLGLVIENPLYHKLTQGIISLGENRIIQRSNMTWSRNFSVSQLDSNKKNIVLSTMSDIAWSIGIRENFERFINEFLDKQL